MNSYQSKAEAVFTAFTSEFGTVYQAPPPSFQYPIGKYTRITVQ